MPYIELPGGCTPIPSEAWAGPEIPAMTEALLKDDVTAADAAYEAWAIETGVVADIPTFPSSDADTLMRNGRPRLAALLLSHGLFSENPSNSDPFILI